MTDDNSGIDIKDLNAVGNSYHTDEKVTGFCNSGDRMMFWDKRGASRVDSHQVKAASDSDAHVA